MSLLSEARFEKGWLKGTAQADLGTEDLNRHQPYQLLVRLKLRGTVLNGSIAATHDDPRPSPSRIGRSCRSSREAGGSVQALRCVGSRARGFGLRAADHLGRVRAHPGAASQLRLPRVAGGVAQGPAIAWTVDDHGRRNVWVATGPDFKARQLTSYADDDGQEITSLQVSADGAWVVYVRGGEHGGNWDTGLPTNTASQPLATKVAIWSAAFSGGPPHLLAEGDAPSISPDNRRVAFLKDGAAWMAPVDGSSEAKRLLFIRGRTKSLTWSPDGSRLAFVSSREAHALIGVYSDEKARFSGSRRPLRAMAHPAGLRTANASPSHGYPVTAAFRHRRSDSSRSPGLSGLPTRRPVRRSRVGRAASRCATRTQTRTWSGRAATASCSSPYQDGWQHLYSMSDSGGEPVLLTAGSYMVEDIALSADKQSLVFNANTGGDPDDIDRRHLYRVAVNGGKTRSLTSGIGLEWSPVITGSNQLVFVSATAQRPPLLATAPTEGGPVRLLTADLLPAVIRRSPGHAAAGDFQVGGCMTVHGQLFEPRSGSDKHAAVLYMHGGPQRQMLLGWHYMAYYSNDYAVNQYLVNRGYVVLAVNYRLGIGYGHDFQFPPGAGRRGAAEIPGHPSGGPVSAIVADVDARRVGLYGGSYGGYLTAMGLSHDSDLFAVGVDIHGVHNWTVDYGADELLPGKRFECRLTPGMRWKSPGSLRPLPPFQVGSRPYC